jgi:hypothetical protein
VFTVFISHKHEDHALAVEVKKALEGLARPKLIDCFVSGIDITAGMDWRREIRSVLARSHLLVLLFTAPSKNWDWCLYETGLYTRFERAEKNQVSSVVCLFSPGQASPSPIADLQGVPVQADKVRAFLDQFCRKTWSISDDWRQGPLAPDVKAKQLEDAARAIERAFRRSGSTSIHFPCHRVVLSLSESDKIESGIPESARVVEGPNDTSDYTLSLFNLGRSPSSGARDRRGMAPGARQQLPPRLERGALLADQGPHALRRQEPTRGAALHSDPLQRRPWARGRAGVGRCGRDRTAAPLRDDRSNPRAAYPGRHGRLRQTTTPDFEEEIRIWD